MHGLMRRERTFRVGGVPEHFNLPWLLAIEASAGEPVGRRVDWTDYPAGTGAMLADLAADRLDLAILLTEGAALGLARGLPVTAVSLYTTSPLIWGVHVPPASRFERLTDLGCARFAISRHGSGSHLMSLALAIEHGFAVGELEFEIVDDLDGAIEAFQNDRADAFLWEHFTTEPSVKAGHFRRIDDFLSPWPAWVISATSTVWDQERPAIESLVSTVAAEAGRLSAAPDAADRIADRYGLESGAVAEWLSKTEWVRTLTSPVAALAAAERMLVEAGAV